MTTLGWRKFGLVERRAVITLRLKTGFSARKIREALALDPEAWGLSPDCLPSQAAITLILRDAELLEGMKPTGKQLMAIPVSSTTKGEKMTHSINNSYDDKAKQIVLKANKDTGLGFSALHRLFSKEPEKWKFPHGRIPSRTTVRAWLKQAHAAAPKPAPMPEPPAKYLTAQVRFLSFEQAQVKSPHADEWLSLTTFCNENHCRFVEFFQPLPCTKPWIFGGIFEVAEFSVGWEIVK